MNRLSERFAPGGIVPVDERRRLLEERIERAKERLLTDIRQASGLVKSATTTASKNLVRAAVFAVGLFLVGMTTLAIVGRRRRRRIRARWR